MGEPEKNHRDAERYSLLRTRWTWISWMAETCVWMALVLACAAWRRQWWPDALADLYVIRYLIAWALAGLDCILLRLPIEFHLAYGLARRFGLATGPALQTFLAVLENVANRTIQLFALVGALLAVRVLAGAGWWIPIMALLALLWGLITWWRRPKRVFGYRVLEPPEPEEFEHLIAFARCRGIENVKILLLDVPGPRGEAVAGYRRRGCTHTVFLGRDLPELMTPDELTAVFAHELGHRGRWRTLEWRRFAAWIICLIAAGEVPFLRHAGEISAMAAVRAVPLSLLVLEIASLLVQPVLLLLSRLDERAANAAALRMTEDPATFASAMRKLAANNLVAGEPGWFDKLFIQSHPSLAEVLAQARRYADRHGPAPGESAGQTSGQSCMLNGDDMTGT